MFFPDVFVVPWFTGVDVSAELGDQIGYIMVQAGYLALALKYILTFWAFMAEIIDGVNVFLKLTALEIADARPGPDPGAWPVRSFWCKAPGSRWIHLSVPPR